MSYIGNDTIGSLFFGSEEIGKAYLGDELVYDNSLPYDAKIEYLQSTGTQYIDTGIKIASNTRSEVKGQYVQNNNTFDILFGCSQSGGINGVFIGMLSGTSEFPNHLYLEIGQTINGNSSFLHSSAQPFALHKFVSDINGSALSFSVDGTTLTGTSRGVYPTNLNLFLFAKNIEGTADRFANARVYYCKIWQGGNLVFDAYPVRVGQVGYMYDTISGQLYGNAGTGAFTLGADVDNRLSLRAAKSYIHKYPTLIVQSQYKWAYQAGLLLLAMLRTHDYYNEADDGILAYATGYYQGLIDNDGDPCKTPGNEIVITNYNLNEVMPACNLLRLIQDEVSGSTWYNRYNTAIGKFATQLVGQPRMTSGTVHPYSCFAADNSAQGGLQMWLDILYMSLPFKAMYAQQRLSGSAQSAYYDDIVGQLIEVHNFTYDSVKHLHRHAFAEASSTVGWKDPDTNGQSYFSWSRAIGWYLMAICEVLDVLPNNHSGRSQLLTILQNECSALLGYRVEGVWRNLPTVDADIKDGVVRNKLESSCSAMFAYVFLHCARMGYLDSTYRAIGKSTYEAVVSHFITYPNGEVQLNDCMSQGNPGRGLSDKDAIRENYYSFGYISDDPHGFGPFVLASLEYEKMF